MFLCESDCFSVVSGICVNARFCVVVCEWSMCECMCGHFCVRVINCFSVGVCE